MAHNLILVDIFPQVWNNEIAVIAQRLAEQCKFEHDKERWEQSIVIIDILNAL